MKKLISLTVLFICLLSFNIDSFGQGPYIAIEIKNNTNEPMFVSYEAVDPTDGCCLMAFWSGTIPANSTHSPQPNWPTSSTCNNNNGLGGYHAASIIAYPVGGSCTNTISAERKQAPCLTASNTAGSSSCLSSYSITTSGSGWITNRITIN